MAGLIGKDGHFKNSCGHSQGRTQSDSPEELPGNVCTQGPVFTAANKEQEG